MIPVVHIDGNVITFYNFPNLKPDATIFIKYGMGALVIDTQETSLREKVYMTTLRHYQIVDDLAARIIRTACDHINNAFVFIQDRFYVHNKNISLPDDYIKTK